MAPRRTEAPKLRFKAGDRVMLVKPHTFHDEPIDPDTRQEVGATGMVVTVYADYPGGAVVDVNWDNTRDMYGDLVCESADPHCLEFEHEPVTAKELAEVYKILGVKP